MRPEVGASQAEIDDLEKKAKACEASALPLAGGIDLDGATGHDEVMLAVLLHKSCGPTAENVLSWLESVDRAALKRGCSFGFQPRRVFLKWHNGVIDAAASYIFVLYLAKQHQGTSPVNYDIASATFHAETAGPAARAA